MDGLSPTLRSGKNDASVLVNDNDMAKVYKIRKLTPLECMRLMNVSDEDVQKMKDAGISDTQLYKMAGNSIVINVLEGIFTQMFRKDSEALF
jgi:DNA (cytosine-5)-methyltransferase 1